MRLTLCTRLLCFEFEEPPKTLTHCPSLYLSHILSQFQVSNCCHATTSTSLAAADAVLPRLDQNRTEQRPQPGKWLTARTKQRIGANKCTSCTRSHQRHLNRFHVVPRSQVQLYTLHWISHPNILGFWSHAPICKRHWKTYLPERVSLIEGFTPGVCPFWSMKKTWYIWRLSLQ